VNAALGELLVALRMMGKRQDIIRDTHGNASVRLEDGRGFAIKPSGMAYGEIDRTHLSIVDIDGKYVSGLKPSVDLPHHLRIYRNNPKINAICHTHSPYATAFALAEESIHCYSTEQADYFGGVIECLPYRDLDEWGGIVSAALSGPTEGSLFTKRAVLLTNHGTLTFADDAIEAVELAIALENVAQKTAIARQINPLAAPRPYDEIQKWRTRYVTKYGQR
jgi:L-ribulose-5-phosphate 4-epimerase